MTGTPPLELALDGGDRIVRLSGSWDASAAEHGDDLLADRLVGTGFFGHIRGEPTRMLLKVTLDRLRAREQPFEFAYRCDTPVLRRHMTMTLSLDDGLAVMRHRLDRVEARQRPMPPALYLAAALQRCCSMCLRVASDGGWVEAEEAPSSVGVSAADAVRRVIYAICDDCRGRVTAAPAIGPGADPTTGSTTR